MALRRLCIEAGCDDLAIEGGNRCLDHLERQTERLRAAKAKAKAATTGWAHLYRSRDWSEAAGRLLRAEPLCRECASVGLVTPASQIDHIVPHRGDVRLFWDRSNWQPLCQRCHSRKTAREVMAGKGARVGGRPGG